MNYDAKKYHSSVFDSLINVYAMTLSSPDKYRVLKSHKIFEYGIEEINLKNIDVDVVEEGLYIVDQHAAQERVKYEYYREEIGKVSPTQQNLLVPIVLTYPTTDSLIINENVDKLKELGIYLEDFGQNTYIIRQHPTWFKEGQEESIIREMI